MTVKELIARLEEMPPDVEIKLESTKEDRYGDLVCIKYYTPSAIYDKDKDEVVIYEGTFQYIKY